MGFLTYDELKKKIEERDIRKQKLKKALMEERKLNGEEYIIDKDEPLNFDRIDIAKNIISKMSSGDSVLVRSENMCRQMVTICKGTNKEVYRKKIDDGLYRVWLL